MSCRRFLAMLPCHLLLALAACGGGGDSPPPPGTRINTLAYVVSECRDDAEGLFERQALRIQQGDREPVTVAAIPDIGPQTGIPGLCQYSTQGRFGGFSVGNGAFTRLTVSPDGSAVVFEMTDELSTTFQNFLTPEQRGLFFVRADGTGLRRLGPPSHQRTFSTDLTNFYGDLAFSPNGRAVAFTDRVQDSGGVETVQIVTVDVTTGKRTQVTHLPPTASTAAFPAACCPRFLNDDRLAFRSFAQPGGLNPEGRFTAFAVNTDGRDLKVLPQPVVLPGSQIVPTFIITGDRPSTLSLLFPDETPQNHIRDYPTIVREVFLVDGRNLLQLTNFQRVDTSPMQLDAERQRVFFTASANPTELHGSNPTENCQIFSIDRTGGDLHQLTSFDAGGHSVNGCGFGGPGRGCGIADGAQDPLTQTLVFYSDCDPGMNPKGGQIFAMRPDGSGLRQLTQTRGLFRDADGVFHAELPGPIAYGPYVP